MEKRKESGMKDVARVWEGRIGKRRGVLKERNDRGKERRTGGSLGWRTELQYAKEPWLKKREKEGERKGNEGCNKGGRKGEKRWRRGGRLGWRLSLDVERKEGEEKMGEQ